MIDNNDPYAFHQMEDGRYQVVTRIYPLMPDSHKQHALLEHRRMVGIGLAEVLQVKKFPAVVDYEETITEPRNDPYGYGTNDHDYGNIRTVITVKPARHQRVVIPSMDEAHAYYWIYGRVTPWQHIKAAAKGIMRGIVK